ncbi:MAG TPA: L,D-transpeptidase family protein [Terriglobales bacterium]
MVRRTLIQPLRVSVVLLWLTISGCGSHPVPLQDHATKVVVIKSEHKLLLLNGDRVIRTYKVAIGRGGLAPKQRQGDHRTPEGAYIVDRRKINSRFHRALHVSYPNDADRARARAAGVDPGGDIMIHGIQNGFGWIGSMHREVDWTDGCIAVTDEQIEEIWAAVPDGTPVEIRR